MVVSRRLISLGLPVLVGVMLYACAGPKGGNVGTMETVTDPGDLVSGKILQLPEGVVKLSEFKVPAGAWVYGAGFDKTIVDAEGKDVAFIIDGVGERDDDFTIIGGLTIRNAGSAGIRVSNAHDVYIHDVRITGPVVGISVSDSGLVDISLCVIDGGNAGISMKNVTDSVVVNNTIARLGSACLGLSDVMDTVVFNNIFADTSTAVIVSGKRDGLVIDYNLHACFAAGKIDGQIARPWLATWKTVSGYDKHSVATGVVFADPDNGDFTPVSMLSWQPGVSTVSRWGVAELAGRDAPKRGIVGKRFDDEDDYTGRVGLGAYHVPINKSAYATDGKFTIQSDEGTKSAGVFTPDGKLVRYLFHDLPLPAGTYDFHLAGQTQLGEAIPAGQYEVRVVEADLGVEYRGFLGSLGSGNTPLDANSLSLVDVAWGSDGQLLLCNSWSEKAMNLVKMDLSTGKGQWAFKGSEFSVGVASDGKGTAYIIRRTSHWSEPINFQVSRVDETDGKPILDEQKNTGATFEGLTKSVNLSSVAFLNGRLYIGDPDANQVLVVDVATMKPLPSISFSSQAGGTRSVTADTKRNLLWAVNNAHIVFAFTPDGTVKHEYSFDGEETDARTLAVAVAGDLLAVADAATGKVSIHDITDPDKAVLKRQIGTGDGPYGPWQADRFIFQAGHNGETLDCHLALKPDGTVAVLGPVFGHLGVFDPAGKPIYHALAHFGNSPVLPHWKTDTKLIIEVSGRMSFWIDTEKQTSGMDAYWGIPKSAVEMVGAFESDGKRFGVFRYQPIGVPRPSGIVICRVEGYTYVPVSLYLPVVGEEKTVWRVHHDLRVDETGETIASDEGTEVAFERVPLSRWISVTAAGDIISTGSVQLGMRWKFTGLDAKGVPQYEVGPDLNLKWSGPELTSPYFFDKKNPIRQSETLEMPGDQGTAACLVFTDTLQTMGFSNSGATDLARFAPDGTLLWLRPMNELAPVLGLKPLGTHLMTSYGHEAWWMLLTNDGLNIGSFGTPAEWNWEGYWLDHPDHTNAFIGKDGRTHIIAGDYMITMTHWLVVTGEETIKHSKFPLTIGADKAKQLASRAVQAYQPTPKSPPPQITIKKLDKPLTMDGDLTKWRRAVPTPQVLVTHDTGMGITSPMDQSAVIRVGWHGTSLYFQLLVFDDVIAEHQTPDKFYKQDGFQMTFNGFQEGGFAFSGATLGDGTEFLFRNRFFLANFNLALDPKHAPRKYFVLDNAKDVTERKYIESIYGVDLSECKVRVYEFAIPIDETSYADDPETLSKMQPFQSGLKFWIGFMLNDVDTIGSDEQPFAVWPSTYFMFATPDKGAIAVLE